MRYLITGGAGFIGSCLADELINRNKQVVTIDDLSTGKKENLNPKAEFYKIDICDFEGIKSLFRGVDGVFHLAAVPRVFFSVKDPVFTSKVNILGTINVFKAAIDNKVKRIVFASSASVYGEQKESPLKESIVPNPVSPYGWQKLAGEQAARLFSELYRIQIICLRYFNVYGPKIDFDSEYGLVVGRFLKLRAEKKPLTIFGSGEQTRGFCYVDDVTKANIAAMESEKLKGGEIINISQKKSYSVNYLAELIGGEVQYLSKRQGDPLHNAADITLAKNLLDWSPKIDFEKGVQLTKEWFWQKYEKR